MHALLLDSQLPAEPLGILPLQLSRVNFHSSSAAHQHPTPSFLTYAAFKADELSLSLEMPLSNIPYKAGGNCKIYQVAQEIFICFFNYATVKKNPTQTQTNITF